MPFYILCTLVVRVAIPKEGPKESCRTEVGLVANASALRFCEVNKGGAAPQSTVVPLEMLPIARKGE